MNTILHRTGSRHWIAVHLAAVLLLSAIAKSTAQFFLPLLPPGADTNEATMTVKVVDSTSGKPLPGSVVMVPSLSPAFGNRGSNQWQFPADANGVAVVRIPGLYVAFSYFGLVVSNVDYPLRQADWSIPTGSVRANLPSEHTFHLEIGTTIGGFVKDENGEPVAGARVGSWGNSAGAFRQEVPGKTPREYSALPRYEDAGVLTDSRGFWIVPNVPRDVVQVYLNVVRQNGAQSVFSTPPPNPGNSYGWEHTKEVSLAALQATNAILALEKGVTIRGTVVDVSGKPVPNTVIRERAGAAWFSIIQSTTNDAQGKFTFLNRAGAQYTLTAEASGFAMTSTTISTGPEMSEAKLVLSPVQPLKVKLLDESNQPIAGAEVSLPDYRNRGHLLTWKGTSDSNGRVTWSSPPGQSLSMQIVSTNHLPRMARVYPDAKEQVIRISKEPAKQVNLRVRATSDAATKPLLNFTVWQDLQPNGEFRLPLANGTNGEARSVLKSGDFPENVGGSYRLQVRAEGHAPQTSEIFYFDEGDIDIAVTLKTARAPAGVVVRPDGQPAAGAGITLLFANGYVYFNGPNNVHHNQGVSVKTAADGAFKFDGAEPDNRLVVMHDSGFATLTVGELPESGRITLRSHGRIEGTIPTPSAGESPQIYLKAPLTWYAGDGFNIHYYASADKAGRFTFTNVPPGDYVLYRMPRPIMGAANTESHRMIVNVAPGETNRVEYTFHGRRVIGHVDAGARVDWMNDAHTLSAKLPPGPSEPSYYAFADPKAFEKARREHARSKAVLDHERKRQEFQLSFDRDGNFYADDVPPGTYELKINVTKPPKDERSRYNRSNETLGSMKREITVPAGPAGEEFDLGNFEMEIKDAVAAQTPPLDFDAETFGGETFSLLKLRGKPVVIAFWGRWAPGSIAAIEGIQSAVNQLDSNVRPALVTVNLDAKPESARDSVQSLGKDWSHTRLPGKAQYEITERLGVDPLPLILLIDAQGRVVSRDLEGKRLASTIKRLAAKKN